ncbi:MAG: zinc ribbon domain-containing protein [Lachnospiraceae bacterium]|nr:zinc ribbon domain-containing protein [Lachnospiraceae bacterium]
MAEDFFSKIGKKISETAQQAADKSSVFVEVQKLNMQIAGENKAIKESCTAVGELVLAQYKEGVEFGPDVKAMLDTILAHERTVEALKANISDLKGERFCPNCGKEQTEDAIFCGHCGTKLPEIVKAEEAPAEEAPAPTVFDIPVEDGEAPVPEIHPEVLDAIEEAKATLEAEKAETSEEA